MDVEIPCGISLIEMAEVERLSRQLGMKEIRKDFLLNSSFLIPHSSLTMSD